MSNYNKIGTSSTTTASSIPELNQITQESLEALNNVGSSSTTAASSIPELNQITQESLQALNNVGSSSTTAASSIPELNQITQESLQALNNVGSSSTTAASSIPELNQITQESLEALNNVGTGAGGGVAGSTATGISAKTIAAHAGMSLAYAAIAVEVAGLCELGIRISADKDTYSAMATDNKSNILILKSDINKLRKIRNNADGGNV